MDQTYCASKEAVYIFPGELRILSRPSVPICAAAARRNEARRVLEE